MSETGPMAQQGWLQRWGLGVIGPAAVLVWAATQQSWGWVAFAGLALAFGAFRLVRPVPSGAEGLRIVWAGGAFALAVAAFSFFLAFVVATRDGKGGAWFIVALLVAWGVAMAIMGVSIFWPRLTARILRG